MIEALIKCPFCGSPAEYTSESKEFVRCSKGLQCPTESAVFTAEDWNNRPLEDELIAEIRGLKNNFRVFYDVLFLTQKQIEEWLNKSPDGKRKDEYSDVLLGIVKTLTKSRNAGITGNICGKCNDEKCTECTLDKIYPKSIN